MEFVVDCCVVKAAGVDSDHDLARTAREFMDAVLDGNHAIVVNQKLRDEYRQPKSAFAIGWLAELKSRRAIREESIQVENLETGIVSLSGKCRIKMLEDLHLIHAAFPDNVPIISNEIQSRQCFSSHSGDFYQLEALLWAGPAIAIDSFEAWTMAGFPPEGHRILGNWEFHQKAKGPS